MNPTPPPLRIVFDTNVALALLVFDDPALRALRAAWDEGHCVALADPETLAEFDRVLRYPEMRLAEADAVVIADRYRAACATIGSDPPRHAAMRLPLCRDPDDQKFLILAQRGNAAFLLTRDKALLSLRRRVPFAIVQPERFVAPAAAAAETPATVTPTAAPAQFARGTE